MPLFEYRCRTCDHEFETLIRPGDTAKCTSCGGEDLEKLLSQTAVSTEQTRSASFSKARERAKKGNRDKEIAQFEYEEKHRHEH